MTSDGYAKICFPLSDLPKTPSNHSLLQTTGVKTTATIQSSRRLHQHPRLQDRLVRL